MAGEARAVVEDAEQDGRHPFAARREHLPRSVMAVPMPQAVDILGLVAADLALDNACLGTLCPFGSARAQAPALVETIGAHEATQGGIGRYRLEVWPRLGQRDEVVMVELDAPALMCGVLRDDDATHGRADGVLLPGVGAQLAAQHADRIGALVERAVVPALDGREAEADRLTRRRMLPGAQAERTKRVLQLALRRRRGQQLADDGEAQVRPPFVNPSSPCLVGHAGAPEDRMRSSIATASERSRRASSAGRPPPSESAHADASRDRTEEA